MEGRRSDASALFLAGAQPHPIRHPGLVPGSTAGQVDPRMRERQPCVYILASAYNGTLYVGVTSNLIGRIIQHREGVFDGYTKKHGVLRLVYFEVADTMEAAIAREKQLKRYRRDWKRNLIERENPTWDDLAVSFGLPPLNGSPRPAVDPGTRPG